MPCVFQNDPETGQVMPDSAEPIMRFSDERPWESPQERLMAKFNYKKITPEKVKAFAKLIGFK